MPGIHTIINYSERNHNPNDFNFLLHESFFFLDTLIQEKEILSFFSQGQYYPKQVWRTNHYHITVEGLIYNLSETTIKDKINGIASKVNEAEVFKNLLEDFVSNTDGDYLVQIYNINEKVLIVFNSYLNRLPYYYYLSDKLCVISKEIKTILHCIPSIELNLEGVIDFLLFEHQFRDATIFKNIFRSKPAQYLKLQMQGANIKSELSNSAHFDFVLRNPFKSVGESVEYLAESYIKAVKNRVDVCRSLNKNIIADLSGGFDSRAILGALAKYTNEVTYYNFEYIQDESKEALDAFLKLNSPGVFKKLKSDYKVEIDGYNLQNIIFKTDGLVNYFSTLVCTSDVKTLYDNASTNSYRFGGLGGEFIRHPYKDSPLFQKFESGFFSTQEVITACRAVNIEPLKYMRLKQDYINSFTEKSQDDILKRLYHDYYNTMVGAAAEDRERNFFWTIHPLWNLNLVKCFCNMIPLDWTGYSFYIKFLKGIDIRLLDTLIYGKKIKLNSGFSVWEFELRYRLGILKNKIKLKIKQFPILFYIKKVIAPANYKDSFISNKDLSRAFQENCTKLTKFNKHIDYKLLENDFMLYGGKYNRALTLLIYLVEVEKRYLEKIE